MSPRLESLTFAAALAVLVSAFFAESLFGGKVLSPADVLLVSASFRDDRGPLYEPSNRLLMDPVLQFQPWLEYNRECLRDGRLPLWNDRAGCGTPHLANGQSAVFDPFHLIAYLGTLPDAYAWMAAARLWIAGLGMFFLARSWGLRPWGRWFAGLCFPFCGFLVVWLLFPVTNVAVWMPWLFLAGDRVLGRPSFRSIGGLALATGLVVFGGHVQTSAHVLLSAGLYVVWRLATGGLGASPWSCLFAWSAGIVLGLAVAAVEIVPLASYLTKSPVWGDRDRERASPWTLTRPRVLDAVCTALPYAFGSQRRGHPHLGRAVGVHNLNESAGGYAGLVTLVALAPLAWGARHRIPRVRFLVLLVGIATLGAYGLPPVDNLLRALPVLNVTDNRRLTLWLAFGLILLGGVGLDRLSETVPQRVAPKLWILAALALVLVAASVGLLEPRLRDKARAHYAKAAAETPGADPKVYLERADHQVRLTLAFYPRYFGLVAAELLALATLVRLWKLGRVSLPALKTALVALALAELFGFGYGLNPAIPRRDDRAGGPLVDYLRREAPPPWRILGLGEELPPNVLMRYGLRDVRNYDSVELTKNLSYFAALYPPGASAWTSRREVTWDGAIRARERLREASVRAIVGSTPPPPGAFDRVEHVGDVWVAHLDGRPWVEGPSRGPAASAESVGGEIIVSCKSENISDIIIREISLPGWYAEADGRRLSINEYLGAFMSVRVPAGARRVLLRYDPHEVRVALATSISALFLAVFALTVSRPFRSTRIIVEGLGRTQAVELESNSSSSPANY